MKTCQNCEYEFSLVLTGITQDSPSVDDSLFNAGCDDATLAFRSGRPILTFYRSGSSLKEAIVSAINDVRRAGIVADVLRCVSFV